jgi:protease-4
VLLYIDSPGGGVTDSDAIYQLVRTFRRDHPEKRVLALFGDIAASGGYYVAVAAEAIVARRTSITGSIGVIMSAWNFAEAAKKLGIDQVAIKSERTPYKDMLSPTRELAPAERAMLTSIVDELFDQFVSVVDEGRANLDREQVLRAANGGIFTARQAKELGLVDEIGDHDTALQWFRQQLGKPVTIVETRRRASLADLLFGSLANKGADGAVAHLLTHSTGPRFLYYWEGGR